MSGIEKIEWESKYSVDIEEIDTHQKKMFELFNQLIDIKASSDDTKVYVNMISEINEYSKLYFKAEEKILKKKDILILKPIQKPIANLQKALSVCDAKFPMT